MAGSLRAALKLNGPAYMRIGKKGDPLVHAREPDFTIGKSITILIPADRLDRSIWTTEIGAGSFLGRTQLRDWVTEGGVGRVLGVVLMLGEAAAVAAFVVPQVAIEDADDERT